MRIAPYGRGEALKYTAVLLAAAAVFYRVSGWACLLPLALWLFVLNFFRDPERALPSDPALLVSAADGKVCEVAEVETAPFVEGRAVKVGIFLNVFDVHVNRSPLAGKVAHLEHKDGKYLNALDPLSAVENERQDLGLEVPGGGRVLVRQISGAIARRIVCQAQVGQDLARGERYGMIKFGSRTEIYLPADRFKVHVRVGDRVKGRETVFGAWS